MIITGKDVQEDPDPDEQLTHAGEAVEKVGITRRGGQHLMCMHVLPQ